MPQYKPNDRFAETGRLGNDIDLRFIPSGKAVVNLNLAVDVGSRDEEGKWQKTGTDWFKVAVWEQLAEHISESLRKGDRVMVQGVYKGENTREREGKTYTDYEVRASSVGPDLRFNTVEIARTERSANRSDAGVTADSGSLA
jgi:single-strand DNA-binding protein